ncbi:hypothetical protein HRW23_26995 [Streptomyces lunaelactis]|nr:hypothetical protein [Streptomyces lunaelactis]NUK38383.1 hypothetical protein [Streptomyces lunaelactis]NUK54734.1 hypothetical protein [Streptomyces lunaelactis]NUK67000.1 hypothetical protein [Streptomyces lunaelactis]NUK74889.1 hypothetical protein [Streptomyces lunaelactis]
MSGHRHRFERYGPDGPFDDRTGNGIVNNGPENELGGLGQEPDQGLGQGLGQGCAGDEVALRRLLQGAVQDLEPSDGALDHLRRAVPARRARKRQALVGVAAAALLIGTAVPAFVHVANSGSGDDARPVNAGHGEEAQGGTGAETGAAGGDKGTDNPSAGGEGTEQDSGAASRSPGDQLGNGTSDGTTGDAANPTGSVAATSPVCDASQLGVSSAQAAKPDADGKVYGTFRIANVSRNDCAVSGSGSVGFQTMGAADPAKITVVAHTAGDAASGLPDPSQEAGSVLLKPDTAYEVRFAWVPTDSCPTTGTSPDPTPSDGGSSGASNGTGTAENTETQLVTEDGGGTTDGSVAVTHTAEPGAPSAETTIPNACAGTIYRTGVLSAQ